MHTVSVTKTISASATTLEVQVYVSPADNAYVEFEWINLTESSVAMPYVIPSKGQELIDCEANYIRFVATGTDAICALFAYTSTEAYGVLYLPTTMRAIPQASFSSVTGFQFLAAGGVNTSSDINAYSLTKNTVAIRYISTGMTPGTAGFMRFASSADWIALSARL
jgi:hypothetical protein